MLTEQFGTPLLAKLLPVQAANPSSMVSLAFASKGDSPALLSAFIITKRCSERSEDHAAPTVQKTRNLDSSAEATMA